MKAIVLAAGRGERLRPITDTTPKPLVEVAGKPLIAYHLEALGRAGVRDIIINLSWLPDRLRERLQDGREFGVRITYSDEGPRPLETGGGIFRALPLLAPGAFLVVNGDVWTDIDFAAVIRRAEYRQAAQSRARRSATPAAMPARALAHLVLVPNPPQHPQGDFALRGDLLVANDPDRLTYSGIGVFWPEFFLGCRAGRFALLPLLLRAMANGQVRGELHRGEWCDIGTPERLMALDERIRRERGAAG